MGGKSNFQFIGERLREARIARGLTAKDLADKIGVSSQAVSQYELGYCQPSTEIFFNIVNTLGFPIAYFQEQVESLEDDMGPVFFRSFSSATKLAREKHLVNGKFIKRIYRFLEKYLDFPSINVQDYSNVSLDDETIENIAKRVRKDWGIGLSPISNLTLLLEKQGIIVSRFFLGEDKLDAYSEWALGRPFIFLCDDKGSAARSNFDLAHELAHLLFHRWIDDVKLNDPKTLKQIEKEANKFAGAFLMPEETFSKEVVSGSLESFVSLKRRWKVSIQAMIYRCEELGYLEEYQALYLRKKISKLKWKTREPLDDEMAFNNPCLFKNAFEMLLKNNVVSVDDIITNIKLDSSEIERLCCLERGMLSSFKNNIISLNFKGTSDENLNYNGA